MTVFGFRRRQSRTDIAAVPSTTSTLHITSCSGASAAGDAPQNWTTNSVKRTSAYLGFVRQRGAMRSAIAFLSAALPSGVTSCVGRLLREQFENRGPDAGQLNRVLLEFLGDVLVLDHERQVTRRKREPPGSARLTTNGSSLTMPVPSGFGSGSAGSAAAAARGPRNTSRRRRRPRRGGGRPSKWESACRGPSSSGLVPRRRRSVLVCQTCRVGVVRNERTSRT